MTTAECNAVQELINEIQEIIDLLEKKLAIRKAIQQAAWIVLNGIPGYQVPPPTDGDELLEWWDEFLIWWASEDRGCE